MFDNNDVPLNVDSVEEDLPLEGDQLTIKVRPEAVNDMHRGHAAILTSELEDVNVFEAYNSIDPSEDPKSQVDMLAYQRSEQEQRDLKSYFDDNLGETAEDVVINTQVYNQMLDEERVKQGSPERQVVESLAGLSPTEIELERAQAELELINVLTDITDDYTTFEKALDVGKAFLPTSIIDNKQIADSYFGADDYLRDIVVGLKDLRRNDPVKFRRILPAFVDTISEDLPKNKQLTLLTAILNPSGEEDLGEFGPFSAAIDVVDLATLGIFAATKIAKLVKAQNAIRLAAKLDNVEVASDVNTAALIDDTGEIAGKVGIDEVTAHANAAPFNVSDLDDAYAVGLSAESVTKIAAVKAKQRKVAEIIRTGDGLLKEELLTPAERLVAEEKFTDTLKSQGIDDVTVVGSTDSSTTFRYREVTPTGKPKIRKGEPAYAERKLDLTLDDVTGVWKKTETGMVASWVKSPTAFARWAGDDVRSAIRMDSTASNVTKLFQTLQVDAMKPIMGKTGIRAFNPKARRELAEIDDVLRAGDEWKDPSGVRGKVFSPDELRGGLVNGVKMNDRQMETYYNLRNLYDELWVIRNDEYRNILKAQGKKELSVAGTPQVGKPMTREGAVASLNQQGAIKVYNSTTDEIVQISGKDVGRLYDEGLVLSKLDTEIKIPNGNHGDDLYDMVVVGDKTIQGLPEKVLSFRQGYVPKVNVGAYWFVKTVGNKTVNGVTNAGVPLKTERMFSSKTEAERWLASLDDKERKGLQLFFDRELEQQVLGSSQVGSGGGLYTGARSFEDIPFGAEGAAGERLNTYEALGQNLQSLENYVTRNQWRMAMQQRWVNSAKAAGFNIDRFEKALIPERDPRGRGLRKMAEQIETWSGFPTASEMRWDGFVSGVMEWGLNSRFVPLKDKTVVRSANWLRHRNNNPVNVVRNTTFHSLLGVFNPAQLFVQAQGAALAASLSNSPMKTFRLQNALATASHFGGDSAVTQVVAKAALVDPKDLAAVTKLWNKTGLESSVNNTADYVAASRGMGVGREALRRGFDKGLMFYRMGELFNRRYSFLVALERAQRSGVIKNLDNVTDNQLKDILADSNNMMMNLSRSNRAAWQRGVVAIPTQFLQVQAKFLETITGVNKSFTVRERGRIMAGQLALYGATGIPLMNLGVRWAQEVLGFSQKDIEELDPTVVEAINNGLWGVFAHNWLGADVDMANRGAIANGMMEFTLDLMFSEATIGEKVVGAFGTIPHRVFNAWKQIKPMLLNEREDDLTNAEILRGMSAIASISSTWNNLQKGYFMNRFNQLNDTRGNVVIANTDFNIETEVMTMIGFQPSELKKVRDRDTLTRSRKEYRAQVTDAVVGHYWNYVQALRGVENETERARVIEHYTLGTQVLMKSLRNEGERQKVRESVNTRLENLEDKKTRSIRQYLEEFSDGQVVEMGSMIASMRANGLIQNDLELPEEDEQ